MTPSRGKKTSAGLSYAQAGVDIAEADELVARLAARTKGIGGFSGAFPLDVRGMEKPTLLASTDGVGTKLLLARRMNKYDTIGIDLVAMVVNDLIVSGAKPLFFLDYYATGKLKAADADRILSGIREGCRQAGIPLIGGETAEMPGLYAPGDFDLAGFGVGIADAANLIDGKAVRPGHVVIGVGSSGVHSNGFSLVRAILEKANVPLGRKYADIGGKIGEALLEPTIIYVKPVLNLMKHLRPAAIAHITGGGLPGNLVRVLPKNCRARLDSASWQVPALFERLEHWGEVEREEMFRVFNMGIGLAVVVAEEDAAKALGHFGKAGLQAWKIGVVEKGQRAVLID